MNDFRGSALRQALIWVIAVKLFGLIVLFDVQVRTLQAVDLPKSFFSRSLEWVLVALLVTAVVRYGLRVIPRSRVHLGVGALLAAHVAALLFAEDRYVALFGAQTHFLGLTFLADMAVLYLATAVAYRGAADGKVLVGAIGLGAAIAITYAFAQDRGLDPIPWAVSGRERPFSTFGNPDALAHFLTATTGLGGSLAVFARQRARWLGVALAGASLAAAAAAATRGTLVGLTFVGLALVAIWIATRGLPGKRTLRLAVAGTVVAAALILAATPLGERARGTLTGAIPFRERLYVWGTSLQAIAERPLLGHGTDNVVALWPRYRGAQDASLLGPSVGNDSAHNWLLQTGLEAGVLGMAAQLGLLGIVTTALGRRVRDPGALVPITLLVVLAGYWGHGLSSFGTIAVDWVPWTAFGIAAAISSPAAGPLPSGSRHTAFVAPLALALAAVGAASGWPAVQANADVFQLRRSLRVPDRAVEFGLAAVGRDPGRADHWNELGRAYFQKAQHRDAVGAFAEATRRAPYEATYWSNLSQTWAALATAGDTSARAAALDSGRRSTTASPNFQPARASLAAVALALGEHTLATEEAGRAIALYSHDPAPFSVLLRAWPMAERRVAREALEVAVRQAETSALRSAAAVVAFDQGDRAAARAHATRAVQLNPGETEAQRVLEATR